MLQTGEESEAERDTKSTAKSVTSVHSPSEKPDTTQCELSTFSPKGSRTPLGPSPRCVLLRKAEHHSACDLSTISFREADTTCSVTSVQSPSGKLGAALSVTSVQSPQSSCAPLGL